MPEAVTSTDFEDASASHRGAAAILLDQSERRGGSTVAMANTWQNVWLVAAASTLHSSARGRDEHGDLESASDSHRGAAATLLDQSELHGGSTELRQLSTQVPEAETSTDVESASATSVSHRGVRVATLLDQSERRGNSTNHRQGVAGRGGKHSPLKYQRQRRAHNLSLPPPRIVEQPQPCSIKWRLHRCKGKHHPVNGVAGRGGKHSPLKCQRQGRARTLRAPPLHPRRTVAWSTRRNLVRSVGASCVYLTRYVFTVQ